MSREQQDGPIDSLGEVSGTAYGLTWRIGLLAAVATFLAGGGIPGRIDLHDSHAVRPVALPA
jgi:hypothetical protein